MSIYVHIKHVILIFIVHRFYSRCAENGLIENSLHSSMKTSGINRASPSANNYQANGRARHLVSLGI